MLSVDFHIKRILSFEYAIAVKESDELKWQTVDQEKWKMFHLGRSTFIEVNDILNKWDIVFMKMEMEKFDEREETVEYICTGLKGSLSIRFKQIFALLFRDTEILCLAS